MLSAHNGKIIRDTDTSPNVYIGLNYRLYQHISQALIEIFKFKVQGMWILCSGYIVLCIERKAGNTKWTALEYLMLFFYESSFMKQFCGMAARTSLLWNHSCPLQTWAFRNEAKWELQNQKRRSRNRLHWQTAQCFQCVTDVSLILLLKHENWIQFRGLICC